MTGARSPLATKPAEAKRVPARTPRLRTHLTASNTPSCSHTCPTPPGRKDHSNYKSYDYLDSHLTAAGWAQAHALGEHVRAAGLRPQLVVVSPLTRAIETAVGCFGDCFYDGGFSSADEGGSRSCNGSGGTSNGGGASASASAAAAAGGDWLMVELRAEDGKRASHPAVPRDSAPPFLCMELCREHLGVSGSDRTQPWQLQVLQQGFAASRLARRMCAGCLLLSFCDARCCMRAQRALSVNMAVACFLPLPFCLGPSQRLPHPPANRRPRPAPSPATDRSTPATSGGPSRPSRPSSQVRNRPAGSWWPVGEPLIRAAQAHPTLHPCPLHRTPAPPPPRHHHKCAPIDPAPSNRRGLQPHRVGGGRPLAARSPGNKRGDSGQG